MAKGKARGESHIFIEDVVDEQRFLPAIDKWYRKETKGLDGNVLLLGCPVWGDKFIDRFLNLCLPSLLASGNLPHLKSGLLLVIHTDAGGLPRLKKGLKHLKIDVRFEIIPENIMKMLPEIEFNKYWLLGACQNFYLQYARRHGMAFHMLMPDHIYSKNYFKNLARISRGHDAIVQSTISGDVVPVEKILDKYRVGKAISINARPLMDAAFKHLHKQMQSMIMNGVDILNAVPLAHCFLFVGSDYIVTYTPHTSLAYMSARLVQECPYRPYNALDTQAPYLIPPKITPYVPQIEDDMAFIEVSDDTKPAHTHPVKLTELCFRFWVTTYFNEDYLRFMALPNYFPVSKRVTKGFAPVDKAKAQKCVDAIIQCIVKSRPYVEKEHKRLKKEMKRAA